MSTPGEKSEPSYNERAAKKDREYIAGYEKAVAGMSAADRKKLALAGLNKPQVEEYHPPRRDDDADEELHPPTFEQSTTPDIAKIVDQIQDELAERHGLTTQQANEIALWHKQEIQDASERLQAFLFQRVVAGFLRPGNVKLRAYGLAIVAGLDALNGLDTQAEAAKRIGVTPAAVSDVVNYWADILGLSRNRFMKGEDARKSYSKARKKNHWRNQKCKRP